MHCEVRQQQGRQGVVVRLAARLHRRHRHVVPPHEVAQAVQVVCQAGGAMHAQHPLPHVRQRQQHARQAAHGLCGGPREEQAVHLHQPHLVLHAEALQALAHVEQVPRAIRHHQHRRRRVARRHPHHLRKHAHLGSGCWEAGVGGGGREWMVVVVVVVLWASGR